MSPAKAFFHAALSLSLVVVPVQALLFGQIAEPYGDQGEYFGHVARALYVAIFFGILLSFVAVALLTGAGLFWQNLRNPGAEPGDAPVRALILNIPALLLPLGGWLALYVLRTLGDPAFGLLEPKPALWTSPVVTTLGSWTGFLWFVGLYGISLTWALRQLPRPKEKGDDT